MADERTVNRSRGSAPNLGHAQLLRFAPTFFAGPIPFIDALTRQYGDIVFLRFRAKRVVILNHPDYFKHVLQTRAHQYVRGQAIEDLWPLLGNGLFVSTGDFWQTQRAMMQPAFDRNPVEAAAVQITNAVADIRRRWEQAVARDTTIDLNTDMRRLTLQSLCRSMLSEEAPFDFDGIDHALATIMDDVCRNNYSPRLIWRAIKESLGRPLLPPAAVREALCYLDTEVTRLIRACREGQPSGMLLALLVDAANHGVIDDRQIRDEVMNLLFAGYETAASALLWTWHLLVTHDTVEQRLHTELDTVLAGRTPTVQDMPALTYTKQILSEALRLYPPVWGFYRVATADDEINGYTIPRDTIVALCPYMLHRHPDFWEEPELFRPERFQPGCSTEAIRSCYVPFGDGPHVCIGKRFALMEMQLALAGLAQAFQLRLVSDARVKPITRITIQPRHALIMRPVPRGMLRHEMEHAPEASSLL